MTEGDSYLFRIFAKKICNFDKVQAVASPFLLFPAQPLSGGT